MTKNKVLFLHLSDIHVESTANPILQRAHLIAATTFAHLPVVGKIMIVLSGDLSWSGLKEQFDLVARLLDEIKVHIAAQAPNISIEVFSCPGNHDCDFGADNETRAVVLDKVQSLGTKAPSHSLIKTATSIQAAFFAFRDSQNKNPRTRDGPLSWHSVVDFSGKNIGVRCLNVAWMSQLRERQGTLVFPPEEIASFEFQHSSGITITVLHHPFNWFGQATYRTFQTNVRHESQIVFTNGTEWRPGAGVSAANA